MFARAERKALEQARSLLTTHDPDHVFAALRAFPVVQLYFRRNVTIPAARKANESTHGRRSSWAQEQESSNLNGEKGCTAGERLVLGRNLNLSRSVNGTAIVEEMVEQAPELFAHVRMQRLRQESHSVSAIASASSSASVIQTEPHITRIMAPFTDPERLQRIGLLADIIQTGRSHPKTGKPVRALRFDPETFREEMLILQFHLLLRDVQFHIAESYRWSRSPIFAQLSNRELQYCHTAIRGNGRHGLQPQTAEHAQAVVEILSGIARARFPDNLSLSS